MTYRITPENFDELPEYVRRRIISLEASTTTRKRRRRLEEEAGRTLVQWVDWYRIPAPWDKSERIRVGDYFAHNANGGARTAVEGAVFKGQGVRRGWPDYTLYLAAGGYHGLVLELKAEGGEVPKPEQMEILERLEAAGWRACIAWGADDAIRAIKRYLGAA